MIKLEERNRGIRLSDPKNLDPIIFRCKTCGCLVRKLEETNSYVLMSVSKSIEENKSTFCAFCARLNEFRGISN